MSTFTVGVFDQTFGDNVYVDGFTTESYAYADAKARTCRMTDEIVREIWATEALADMKVRTLPVSGDNPYTVVIEWKYVDDDCHFAYVVRTIAVKSRPQV